MKNREIHGKRFLYCNTSKMEFLHSFLQLGDFAPNTLRQLGPALTYCFIDNTGCKTYNHTIILFFLKIRIQVFRFLIFLVFTQYCFHFISILLSHSVHTALCRQISLPVAHQLWVYRDANNGTLKCWNHATFQPMLSI